MPASPQIRPAQPDDAERAAVLLYSAYTHSPVTYPLEDERVRGMLARLEQYFRRDGNRVSYHYAQVARQQSAVVGLVLSFGGQDEPSLNAAMDIRLEREAKDDEWYVDALAVLKDWNGQGIGTRLLETAEQQARRHNYGKIALHVAQENKRAIDLYAHRQYVITHTTVLYERLYVHMEKTLATGGEGNVSS